MTIENAPLAAEPELREDPQRSLLKLVEGLLSSREAAAVADVTMDWISNIFPFELICIAQFNDQRVQILGIQGWEDLRLNAGKEMSITEWHGIAKTAQDDEVIHWSSTDRVGEGYRSSTLSNTPGMAYVSLPLNHHDQVIGNLILGSSRDDPLDPNSLSLLEELTGYLALALANASEHEAAQKRANEFAELYNLSLEMSAEIELRSLLEISLQKATMLLNSFMGAIFLIDPVIDEITLVAQQNLPHAPATLNLRRGHGLAGRVWQCAEPLSVLAKRNLGDPQWLESCYARGAAVGVPLSWEGEVRGALIIFEPGATQKFSSEEVQLLEIISTRISLGIKQVKYREQVNRRVNQLRVVNDVARRISTILDQEQLFTEIVRRIANSLNLELVILFLLENEDLVEKASYYLPGDEHGTWDPLHMRIDQQSICGKVAREGKPLLIKNVAKSPDYVRVLPFEGKVQSAACIPLKLQGKVIGVLLSESERLAAFDNTDLDTLQALGAQISTCIDNARLYTQTVNVQSRLAESEKLHSLGLMTSGIVHDFNNLLAVILSRAELALRLVEDDELKRHLEQVIVSAKDGGGTIRRLQEFARTRREPSDFIGLDLNEIVREAVELSEPQWKDRSRNGGVHIDLRTELAAEKPIHGAPAQLRDTVINLIINAAEAMPHGGEIVIRTDTNPTGASLVISDTGMGMTEQVKEQLFVPFFTTKSEGTGLGLSMVYGVIQRHGGSIEIDSIPGQGTTIAIWLPTTWQDEGLSEGLDRPQIEEPVDPISILIVEDEELIRESLVTSFSAAGYDVLSAADGIEALDCYLETENIDIVITDLGMPRMSGWRLIEQLRAHDTRLPIMIISGWGDEVSPERILRYGIDKVIAKPFTVSELRIAMEEVMSLRRIADGNTSR